MIINSERLTGAAGLCAVVAGAIFLGVQVNHPPLELASVVGTEMIIRNAAKAIMAMLVLAGITGMYLRQIRQAGVLGLLGYLVFGLGYFAMFVVEVIAAFVLPTLARTAPGYVEDILVAAGGGTPVGDIGLMQVVFTLSGIGYIVGGLLFGIALFRARVLARWAAALLAVGTGATLALQLLPDAFNRPFAVPTAVALIGLGLSLWRSTRPSKIINQRPAVGVDQPAVR
ncbi:hypothetical protein [Microlunatus speluncae]|uniref:hypothetical protein n=1 Tax=Microlunatus speluncae TaxID=2594267 RepID=UPI0012665114|nr:hypothetical protein [Microlunatus speluncae]